MVRAHVVLKGPRGSATSGTPSLAKDVQGCVADTATRDVVRERLEELGFSVRRVSGMSITVEAPVATFEAIFGVRLKRVGVEEQLPGEEDVMDEAFLGKRDAWAWSESPHIPERLSEFVDSLVFPQPTRKMTSSND